MEQSTSVGIRRVVLCTLSSACILLLRESCLLAFDNPNEKTTELELRVGAPITVMLRAEDPVLEGRGPAKRFRFAPPEGGPFTVSAESFDFDVYLRIENSDGSLVGEFDGGGVATNARTLLTAASDTVYRLIVAATDLTHGEGELAISVTGGDFERLNEKAMTQAAGSYWGAAAERALQRNDYRASANRREKEGKVFRRLGELPRARVAFELSLELYRKSEHRRGEAAALSNLGNVHFDLSDYGRAKDLYEASLAVFRELENQKEEGIALGNLGNVARAQGQVPLALELYQQASAIARASGDLSEVARLSLNTGAAHRSLGDPNAAREHFQQAMELYRDLKDLTGEMRALGNLGVIHFEQGNYSRARECYEQVLASARTRGNRLMEATALGNLGNAHSAVGDYAAGREYYRQHLALARELGDRAGEARALTNLGIVEESLGNSTEAQRYQERRLELSRSLGDIDGEAIALIRLGTIHNRLEDYGAAVKCFRQALDIVTGAKLRLHRIDAQIGLAMALARTEAGAVEALTVLGEALENARSVGDRPSESYALSSLGAVNYSLGNYALAREQYELCVELWRRLASDENCMLPLGMLAKIAMRESDGDAALRHLQAAEAILARFLSQELAASERSGVRTRLATLGTLFVDLAVLSTKSESPAGEVSTLNQTLDELFASSAAWKGRTLLEGIVEHRHGARSSEVTALRRERAALISRRNATLEQVSSAIRRGDDPSKIEPLREEARGLLIAADACVVRLRELYPREAALDTFTRTSTAQVRGALSESTLLIEYAAGEKLFGAFVLEAGASGPIRFVPLGQLSEIEPAIATYLRLIGDPTALGSAGEIESAGHALYATLLEPILAQTVSAPLRLMIVPTDLLVALPFESLVIGVRDKNLKEPGSSLSFGDLEFVLDRFEIGYAPSSGVLVELEAIGARSEPGRALIVADPIYASELSASNVALANPKIVEPEQSSAHNAIAASSFGIGMRAAPNPAALARIPGARAEALAIASVLEPASATWQEESVGRERSVRRATDQVELHTGTNATPEIFAENLRRCSILHIAAHGHVNSAHPELTGVALTPSGSSGGYLTIGDVLELDLDANLVVLSACETGRGRVLAGEGVQSLARAFMYAGARSVVASLWKVSDDAAQKTMTHFYRELVASGKAPASALRSAKLIVRSEGGRDLLRGLSEVKPFTIEPGHPFLWGPYIYMGLLRRE